jgi:hypothetical protein
MSSSEQPDSRRFLVRPWATWLFGTIAAVQALAFMDNVVDNEWILAAFFGLTTVTFIALTIVVLRFRRLAKR